MALDQGDQVGKTAGAISAVNMRQSESLYKRSCSYYHLIHIFLLIIVKLNHHPTFLLHLFISSIQNFLTVPKYGDHVSKNITFAFQDWEKCYNCTFFAYISFMVRLRMLRIYCVFIAYMLREFDV